MKNRIYILGLHLSHFFALAFGFEHYIVPIYGYDGYVWVPDEYKFFTALVTILGLSLITPTTSQKPSTLFYNMILILVLIPMLVLFYAENKPWEYTILIVITYFSTFIFYNFSKINSPQFISISKNKLLHNLFLVSILYIVIVFSFGGGKYLNFDLSKVYDLRTVAKDNLPEIFGYISPLIGKVIVPVAFVLALLYKKYFMAIVLFSISILIFGLTAHKAPLFYPFLIFFVYFLSSGKNSIIKFNIIVLFILLVSIGDFWLAQEYDNDFFGWLGSLLMRRSFIVPSEINYMYYDFFSRHEWVIFSNSKISFGLLDYPYQVDVPHLIGLKYFNNIETGANAGWFGSGYMQAGFIGLLFYSLVISAIFKYIDVCAQHSGDLGLITASTIVPVWAMITSTDLPTAFLTHGLFINLVLIAFFHREESLHAFSTFKQRSPA